MKMKLLAIVFCSCVCIACARHSSTVCLVYNDTFSKDTSICLEKTRMTPAQLNPRCMLLSHGKILIRNSTMANSIYSVFDYPDMNYLSYFGDLSEYIIPLEQLNEELYLVRSDSLCSYKWVEGDSLKQFSSSYFYDVMGQRMLGVAKLKDNLYAYANNSFDKGVNEFFMIDVYKKLKEPTGTFPNSHVNYKSISDFKSAYSHEVLAKPDGERLLVFYHRTRRCRIYDQNGKLLRDILLNYDPCQNVVDTDVRRRFIHIRDAYVTDNSIYLLCPESNEENSYSNLLVGNWDGEFTIRYRMDQSISYFFVDESLNRFCGINSNDSHHFYLFNLDRS